MIPAPSSGGEEAVRSPFRYFTAREWGRLRDSDSLPLSESDLARLRGRGETISLAEAGQIYLPLARLIDLYMASERALHKTAGEFLGQTLPRVPYIVGLAGSVAAGKSTAGRILQALLKRRAGRKRVDLVATDGFLLSNAELERRGLMEKKGFPESFNLKGLLDFLWQVKSGAASVSAPVYSHHAYDVVPGAQTLVENPDVVIVEGLNVLQPGFGPGMSVSDFFDFSVYLDASEESLRRWYVRRFLELRMTAFQDPAAYFHRYAGLDDSEAQRVAESIWRRTNLVNLRENIHPTRWRADLVLGKSDDHGIRDVWLRKL